MRAPQLRLVFPNRIGSAFGVVTEALSTKGSAGVELLTKCMNRYFSQVLAGCAPLCSMLRTLLKLADGGVQAGWAPITASSCMPRR